MGKINKREKAIIFSISILVILGLMYVARESIYNFLKLLMNGQELKQYLEQFGYLASVIFILFQVIQVVIFIIPGEVIQAAGGYVFGTFWGTVLSLLGIGIGSLILFIVSHKYGRSFVCKFVSKEHQEKLENILNARRQRLIVFILYLIPGVPKDSLVMICGLTNITAKDFITWSMLGRVPALFLSSYFGANIAEGRNMKAVIICVVTVIVVIIASLYKDKIFKKLSKIK